MTTILRLTAREDETLDRLARAAHSSKHHALAAAIDLAAPRPDHPEFVRATTERLLERYAGLVARLAAA